MILDLNRFITDGRPLWSELESMLDSLDRDPNLQLDLSLLQRFHYLYQRSSADLAKLAEFSARQDVKSYLEAIVARAYAVIHKSGRPTSRFNFLKWLFYTFPATFRKHIAAFQLSLAILLVGSLFGAAAIALDSSSKPALMPFSHLMQDPTQRVADEEAAKTDRIAGHKSGFASHLIANNTRVAFLALSLGITWGVGTLLVLFSNGVYLGATIADYILADQTRFLMGWLLPHGSIELPAIVLAAQAGFILAWAVIGPGKKGRALTIKARFRTVWADLLTLMGGVCLMLVWAGFIEAFLSQYHEPVISYTTKILFGAAQLAALFIFLFYAGKSPVKKEKGAEAP